MTERELVVLEETKNSIERRNDEELLEWYGFLIDNCATPLKAETLLLLRNELRRREVKCPYD